MRKFKNLNSVSVTSRVWRSPTGHRIHWRGDSTLFENFVAQVQAYARSNNQPVPSSEELEDLMCQQSPTRDCTGDPNYHMPEVQHVTQEVRSGGCRSCGR